ncbi:MAG: Fe(2+) transporter permease subunit FeoB [Rhodocyclales bacterium]|nr:Fe(2+) transporter permease subunit FeoB [Rhodocyclales bacterium]
MTNTYTIALVGNPNCGKTTLFNALTGAKQRVGNWPGVTVEKKTGEYRFEDDKVEVVDLPGTYSLDVVSEDISLDERIARDYVLSGEADLVVNVIDAANLERNLYLTLQLAEMQVPLLVALNMVDVAEKKGMKIDVAALAERLGCPVVPIVASENRGIAELKAAIRQAIATPPQPGAVPYGAEVEAALAELVPELEPVAASKSWSPRWLAVRLLEGDALARSSVDEALAQRAQALAQSFGGELDILVADARYSLANDIVRHAVHLAGQAPADLTERIDRIVLNRALGIPIFLAAMYLMFLFTIRVGGAFIDFFDQLAEAIFVNAFDEALTALGSPDWLTGLLAHGVGGGIQTVATFIPVIGFLYLFLSVLEDSGYMARAAFVMDRFMRWVGLPGKSFVPLIVGFGCNVPAIMATRTLEHRRDRLMTIAMAPFMSCGARLPVYALFAAAFFPTGGENVIFALYLIGIAVAVLTGLVLKNTLLKGEATPFIMELPPYHLPTARGVLRHTWDRLKTFIVRAGRLIVPMVVVINFLNAIGTDGSYGNEHSDKSVLAAVGRTLSPVFAPMGLSEENWPATVGIFTGVLAKEAVIGTLNATYTALAAEDAGAAQEEEEAFSLSDAIAAAFATIPHNLADALGAWADPLGLRQAEEGSEEVSQAAFGAMAARFDGALGAFAYLLFILLYTPCTAATAAIYQESGRRWTLFVVAWTTGIAWAAATLFYQAATFSRAPLASAAWIAGIAVLFALVFVLMRRASASLATREAAKTLPHGLAP